MRQYIKSGSLALAASGLLATSVYAEHTCPKYGGVLNSESMHYARVDPTQTANPHGLMNLVYDALLNLEHDLSITPGLAEAMPEQIDELTYEFKLRDGVTFHDGTPFNADAVKFNFDRLVAGEVPSPFTGTWAEFADNVEVVDDHTVRFHLKKPWPSFIWEVATTLRYASPTSVAELGEDYGITGAAGTGPFVFESFEPKKLMNVVRNDNYYRVGEPCLDGVNVKLIQSGSVRILSVIKGDLDHINTFPESQFPQFDGAENVTIVEGEATSFTVLPVNTRHPALADKRVRQAIQYAVNGKELIDNVYGGAGAEIESIFPPWHKGFSEAADLSPVRPDIEKAKALIAEAGYGPDGETLTLSLKTGSGGAHVQRAILLQAQLAEIGIELELEHKSFGQILQEMFAGKYHLVLWQINGGTSLKDFTWNLYASNSGNNVTGYNQEGGFQNPRVEELVQLISATEDPTEVADELGELQAIVFDDNPFIYLNFRNHRSAYQNYVKNYEIAKLKGWDDYRRVWLDQ